jgi:phospholipid/cholesterol/gamma-HCH transport system substrate-binding protein
MEARREQVFVGLFVIVAAGLLILTVFSLSGVFASSTRTFRAVFSNMAGIEAGTSVRYEGGPKVGRVKKIYIDPKDPALLDLEFSVKNDIPVKTDTHVAILSFSPLGDNHLELTAGSPNAPWAPNGAVLPSDPYIGFNDLMAEINSLSPQAKQLLANLNDRVTELKVTIDRVNDLLKDKNRENISATLTNLRQMIAENRPQIRSTINNVDQATQKLRPLLDQMEKTLDQANGTLKNVDGLVVDNRADVRASVIKLRESLDNVSGITAQLQQMLYNNDENIDELLNNLRIVSENLKQFTDTIKTRPASLIRSGGGPDRKPGDKQ